MGGYSNMILQKERLSLTALCHYLIISLLCYIRSHAFEMSQCPLSVSVSSMLVPEANEHHPALSDLGVSGQLPHRTSAYFISFIHITLSLIRLQLLSDITFTHLSMALD